MLSLSVKDIGFNVLANHAGDAMSENNYLTAMRYYEKLHNKYPTNDEYSVDLLQLY